MIIQIMLPFYNGFVEISTEKLTKGGKALRFGFDLKENASSVGQIVLGTGITHRVPEGFGGDVNNERDSWERILFKNYNKELNFGTEFYFSVSINALENSISAFVDGEPIVFR